MSAEALSQGTPTIEQEVKLTKSEIVKAFWRWTFFSHANYNYERLEATGLIHGLSPVLKKLYGDDPEEMKAALQRHMQFFNTEPHFGGVIGGMVVAMEEQRRNGAPINDQTINGLKTGLMGPLAGIGDTLWQGTLIPILLSFTISFGSQGNIFLGPILFTLLHFGIMFPIAYIMWMRGYYLGRDGITKILSGSLLPKVMTFSQTMGAIVIGALSATFVNVSSPLKFSIGEGTMSLQADVFDKLVLGILPFAITLLTYFLLKKQLKPNTVLFILIAIGAIGGIVGLF